MERRARRVHRGQQAPVPDRCPACERLAAEAGPSLPEAIRRQLRQVQHEVAPLRHSAPISTGASVAVA